MVVDTQPSLRVVHDARWNRQNSQGAAREPTGESYQRRLKRESRAFVEVAASLLGKGVRDSELSLGQRDACLWMKGRRRSDFFPREYRGTNKLTHAAADARHRCPHQPGTFARTVRLLSSASRHWGHRLISDLTMRLAGSMRRNHKGRGQKVVISGSSIPTPIHSFARGRDMMFKRT